MSRLRTTEPWQFYRGSLCGLILLSVVGWLGFRLPFPSSVTVPVMTEWAAETSVRTRAEGFVEEIYVHDGQTVSVGDPLIRLGNEELKAELLQLEAEAEANRIQQRGATGGHDESGLLNLLAEATAIDERTQAIRQRVDSLLVRATVAGQVIAPQIDQLHGTYLDEGRHLLNIVNGSDQEWTALIAPQQIRTVRNHRDDSVVVQLVDGREINTRLVRIAPSASDRLPYPSLAAINGGSLPTKVATGAKKEDELRLIQPHFQAWLAVPPDVNVPTGMRLIANCGVRHETLAVRAQGWIRDLWHGRDRKW